MACTRSSFLRVALPGVATIATFPRIAQAASPTAFRGSYRYVGGSAQREKLEAQIEQIVAQLNFMIRNMARARMLEGLSPRATLDFDFGAGGDRVVFERPGEPPIKGPLDGSPVSWTNARREKLELRMGFSANTLSIRYRGDGSDSHYTYRFSEEGGRLELRGRIDHVRMPGTLRYGLSYRRR